MASLKHHMTVLGFETELLRVKTIDVILCVFYYLTNTQIFGPCHAPCYGDQSPYIDIYPPKYTHCLQHNICNGDRIFLQ